MGSAQGVFIMAGDQPRAFAFGNSVFPLTAITVNQASMPLYKQSVYSAFQAIVTGTGALTATVTIQGSNDDNTGRGFTPGGALAPGFLIVTVNANAVITSPLLRFYQGLVGATVSMPGVPLGATIISVAAGGGSATISANATATNALGVQASIFANNWVSTPLGVITLNGTTNVTDGFQSQSCWRYMRASVTGITGTNATVNVLMGV